MAKTVLDVLAFISGDKQRRVTVPLRIEKGDIYVGPAKVATLMPGTDAPRCGSRLVEAERALSAFFASRPKFGAARVLAGVDDFAADGAGSGEEVEQHVAVAPADRALQPRQVFGEAAQDFQHGFAVVQEDVAPHRRVGGGDAGEVAKAAGGEFDHFALRDLLQVVGGADDVVGDQVRARGW